MTNVTWLRRPFSTTFTSHMTSTAILNSYKDHVTTAAILFTQSLINPWRPYSNTKPRDTTATILNHAWPRRPSWISRDLGGHLGSRVTSAAILDLAWPRRPSWISRDLGGHLKSRVISAAILILTKLRQSQTNNLSKLLTEKKLLKCSLLWASQYRSCWCSVAIKRQSICSHSTVTITLSKVRATTTNTL